MGVPLVYSKYYNRICLRTDGNQEIYQTVGILDISESSTRRIRLHSVPMRHSARYVGQKVRDNDIVHCLRLSGITLRLTKPRRREPEYGTVWRRIRIRPP
jgi:hypothetical protein